MYVKRNIEARSCNHFCSEKAISVTHNGCVLVALVIQLAMCMPNIVFCLPGTILLFHIFSSTARFS